MLQDTQVGDADPAVVAQHGYGAGDTVYGIAIETTSGLYSNTHTTTQGCCSGWYQKGLGGATWINYPFPAYGFQNGTVNRWEPLGSNSPPTSDRQGRVLGGWPFIYSRGGSAMAAQRGYKGRSRIFRYEVQQVGVRPYGDKSRWILGAYSIPWDGSTDMVT